MEEKFDKFYAEWSEHDKRWRKRVKMLDVVMFFGLFVLGLYGAVSICWYFTQLLAVWPG